MTHEHGWYIQFGESHISGAFVVPGIHVHFPLDDFLLLISSWSSVVSLWRSEILERDKEIWKAGEAFNRSQQPSNIFQHQPSPSHQ